MRAVRWNPAKQPDAYAYYARLRRQTPIFRAHIPTRGLGWVVTRYDDVLQVLKDSRFSSDPRFSRSPPLFGFGGRFAPRLLKLVGESMICVDDPGHARLRKLVSKAFTPRSVEDMGTGISELVHGMLDEAGRRGRIDLMSDFAVPLPLRVISDMLGIPEESRLSFHHQIVRLIEVNDMPVKRAIRWLPAMPRLARFFDDLVALKRREPDDKLISRLLQARDGGDALTGDELVAMIFLLLFAGHETSVNLIGNGLLALIDHPEQMDFLRANLGQMDKAVDELLRYTNPVEYGTMRFAKEDLEVGGVAIAKGDAIMALHASANRDETVFAEPDRLDIHRKENRHLALGFGLHYCLGSTLGRLETRIALNAILARFPDLSLAVPRERIRWRQSSGLRGVLEMPLQMGRDLGRDAAIADEIRKPAA